MVMKKYERIIRIHQRRHGNDPLVLVEHYRKGIALSMTDTALIDKFQSKKRGWKKAGNMLYDQVVAVNKQREIEYNEWKNRTKKNHKVS